MTDRRRLEERIARAVARADVSGRPSLVTVATRAQDVDPLAVALAAGAPFAYWELPRRGFAVAALGEAHSLVPAAGPDRFSAASSALHELATRTHQVAFEGVERGPVMLGGFSFHDRSRWPDFPSGRLVLPRLAFIRRGPTGTVWVAATKVLGSDDPAAHAEILLARIGRARQLRLERITPEVIDHPYAKTVDLGDPLLLGAATDAVRTVRGGALQKLVLARSLDLDHRPELGPFLAALRHIHNGSAVFAFARPEGSIFCGATPELLARLDGVTVSTLALAGTVRRGVTPSEDALLADRLRADPKEREEHRHVHAEISRRLDREGFVLGRQEPTDVLRLPGIQHLATPVTAVAPVGTNVLDVVGALHPTPAVAGLPRDRAIEWISEHEGFDRGWYSGPVGYCDLAGNGEFHVALRSCLIDRDRTRLFAGAGIVAASSPEREIEETNLKLGALLPSLFGMKDHRWRTYATAHALFAALRAGSVKGVVTSPGSRNTPLVLAAVAEGLPCWTVLDERSAGFMALGMAKASGCLVALVCTSGSAAANYLPAVAEADRARVPLVVITADRPPGFLDRDAPQTIDQVNLYGSRVRASSYLPVAHQCHPDRVIEEMLRLLQTARPPAAGPVHVNVPFGKPLEPPHRRDFLTDVRPADSPAAPEVDLEQLEHLDLFIRRAKRGVIMVGPWAGSSDERLAIARIASVAGWPILADGMSGMRQGNHANLVTGVDLLLRDTSFVASHLPDAVLRIGALPTGTATQNWLAHLDAPQAILDPDLRWKAQGPELVLRGPISALLDALSPAPTPPGWLASWQIAEEGMRKRRSRERDMHHDTELAVTASVLESERVVWVASSMPVRHLDAMMEPGCSARVFGNRGASGIDGTIASAVGASLALQRRVTVLMGDLAFLHDVGSLAVAQQLGADLSLVVLDNGGGVIFESLPYLRSLRRSGSPTAYAEARELFVTPHQQDLVSIAAGFGIPAKRVEPGSVRTALDGMRRQEGPNVLVVLTDPDAMFTAYERLAGH